MEKNVWHFKYFIKSRLNEYVCEKRQIIKINDFKYAFGEWNRLDDGQIVHDDVFEVVCKKNGRVNYDNLFVQIVNKLNGSLLLNEETSLLSENIMSLSRAKKCKPLNVILLSYDSISRSSWFKRAPKSAKYALETMKFELLSGYNIIGDGTPGMFID